MDEQKNNYLIIFNTTKKENTPNIPNSIRVKLKLI